MKKADSDVNLEGVSQKSEVWVKKWVDYSSKYGIGYILSNGSAGVFFNDSTKILIEPGSSYFYYMERNPEK
jgi:polo-like kinase 1